MARLDPSSVQGFAEQKSAWLAEALERLPVAIGLIDASGKFIANNGALRGLLGPVIPSRNADAIKAWQVFDDAGHKVEPNNWPSEKTLRGGHTMNGAEGVYMPNTDQERRLRLFSTPFVDASGSSAGLILMQDVALERRAQEHKFGQMQQRFVDALVTTIRQVAHSDETAADAHSIVAQTMGFTGAVRKAPDGLSPREEEVLRLMAWGNSRKQIGAQLGIAVKTVEFHRSSAARKLDLKSRVDVVRYAIDRGWMNVGS